MTDRTSNLTRRTMLATSAAAGLSVAVEGPAVAESIGDDGPSAIRPFRVNVPDEALVDLRRRLAATRWPEQETVLDESQGAPLATIQELVALLADRLRLAQGRGETERPAAIRDRDRWAGYPFHPYSLEA